MEIERVQKDSMKIIMKKSNNALKLGFNCLNPSFPEGLGLNVYFPRIWVIRETKQNLEHISKINEFNNFNSMKKNKKISNI